MDHPVVAVNDLGTARDIYENLGFTVPPRGSHIEWGTGNLCIMFADDYLEMRGILDSSRFLMHLDEHLARHGEGLMGIAFRTDDIDRSFSEMTRNGVDSAPPRRLTRNFELTEGWTQPSFDICVPAAEAIEGLMHVVVLKHLSPELIRKPEYLQHRNSAVGINSVSGILLDAEHVSLKMIRLFGAAAVTKNADGVHITLPTGQCVHLLHRQDFETRFAITPTVENRTELIAMEIRVGDLSAAKSALSVGQLAFSESDQQRIRVASANTCGVLLDFTEAPPS